MSTFYLYELRKQWRTHLAYYFCFGAHSLHLLFLFAQHRSILLLSSWSIFIFKEMYISIYLLLLHVNQRDGDKRSGRTVAIWDIWRILLRICNLETECCFWITYPFLPAPKIQIERSISSTKSCTRHNSLRSVLSWPVHLYMALKWL